jgi:hypothetical protein
VHSTGIEFGGWQNDNVVVFDSHKFANSKGWTTESVCANSCASKPPIFHGYGL